MEVCDLCLVGLVDKLFIWYVVSIICSLKQLECDHSSVML